MKEIIGHWQEKIDPSLRRIKFDKRTLKEGYSNNSNYFGDWFGKGQIDYSKIIDNDGKGDVYLVKIWGGKGMILDVYLVRAEDVYEAIDKVFRWSYENEGKNKLIKDREYLENLCHEDYEDEYFYGKDGGKPSDKMSYEDFEEKWFEESFIEDSDGELYAYSENFFVDKVPEKYLKDTVKESYNDVSEDEARELYLYIDNDSDLYHRKTLPIIANLKRKYKRGIYDRDLAVKLWIRSWFNDHVQQSNQT